MASMQNPADSISTILIIDDTPANIRLLAGLVERFGEVHFATDPETGIAMARQNPPDLILCDVEMPGIDGYEVCRRIKRDEQTCDTPIIVVTAHQGAEHEVRALEAGAHDFLPRPLNPPVVQARVRNQLQLKRQGDELRSLVRRDALTGVFNRRHFDACLQQEFARARRLQLPLGLAMIDIDHFKRYNDHYGHLEGDACLITVAQALSAATRRPGEVFCRYGGEEFAAILPGSDADDSRRYGNWIVTTVRDLNLPHEQSLDSPNVSISVGVSALVPGGVFEARDLKAAADAALYRAKSAGRNRHAYADATTATEALS